MTPKERERRDLRQHDDRIQREAALAAEYQKQQPGMTRDEALRLAAAHVAKDMDK